VKENNTCNIKKIGGISAAVVYVGTSSQMFFLFLSQNSRKLNCLNRRIFCIIGGFAVPGDIFRRITPSKTTQGGYQHC